MTPGRKTSRRRQGWQAWGKRVALTQIAAQIGMIVAPLYTTHVYAQSAEAQEQEQEERESEHEQQAPQDAKLQKLAEIVQQVGEASNVPNGSVDLKAMAGQQLSSGAASAAENYLNRFGTARVDLGAMHDMRNFSGALDTLIPLADSESNLVFTQLGLRRNDGQITGNLGVGHRHFTEHWMLGVNAFYDQNISRGHQRAGFGVEAWRDYLKLSGNAYLRISDWKASPDLLDYDERPANGFDVRAEGYLPAMPSLGAKLMYEQYFGNEVGLFGASNRQSNPAAVTLGLSYTPISLVSFGVDHRRGAGNSSTSANVQFTYQLGQPWAKQVDSRQVAARRSLAGSRTDLVERNNNIVLEYRKRQLIKLNLPAQVAGKSANTVDLHYTIESKYGLGRIQWQDGALAAAGGAVVDAGNGTYQVRLPLYQPGTANTYPLTGVAYDVQGNASQMASTTVIVSPGDPDAAKTTVSASPLMIPATGKGTSVVTINLADKDGNAIGGAAQALNTTLTETLDTTGAVTSSLPAQPATIGPVAEVQPGVYQATLTSGTRPGTIVVSPKVHDTALTEVTIAEVADAASARIDAGNFVVIADGMVANGTATNEVRARVTDEAGNPVSNVDVAFTLSGTAQVAPGGSLTQKTDAQGYVTLSIINLKAETVTVGATLVNGAQASVQVKFIADAATASLQGSDLGVDKTVVTANGADRAHFTGTVKDANQNVVPGVTVTWGNDAGNLSAATGVTDDNGVVTVNLTHTQAANVQVSAQVGAASAVNAPVVTFVADSDSANIGSGDLSVDKTSIVANNTDAATFTAIVKDANGNVVPNVDVVWKTDRGTLNGPTSKTNASGEATITLRGTLAGTAQVTAQVGTSGAVNAPAVTLVADSASAAIGSGDLSVDKMSIVADNTDAATFSAIVKDANGNVVPNVEVTWATNHGSLSGTTSKTDANGKATIALRGTLVGTAQVTAQVGTAGAVNAPAVTLVSDSASATIGSGDLTVDKTSIVANDTEVATFSAIVKDANGNVVPNVDVTWATNHGSLSGTTSKTDANGKATITLRGTLVGAAQVTAQVGTSGAVNAPVVTFVADSASANIGSGDLSVDKTSIVADNTDAATFSAVVKDANGNVVPNVNVTWGTNHGSLSGTTSKTDANGKATITLRGTLVGTAQVTAQVGTSGAVNAPVVTFVADGASANIGNGDLAADKTSAVANGTEIITYTAIVKDGNGNVVPNLPVAWATDRGTLSGTSSMTDASGVATITLHSTQAGTAQVTAQVGTSGAVNAPAVTFVADSASANIGSGDLSVDKTSIVANNADAATFSAIVKDANGNVVPNVDVTWATNHGSLSGTTSKTDASGKATITLSGMVIGAAQVTAQVGTSGAVNAPVVTFVADSASATIDSGDLTVDKTSIVADNADVATFSAIVKDANGNVVPDLDVTWATNHGSLSGTTSRTNASGEATIELRGTRVGTAQVTAAVSASPAVNAPLVAMTANFATARVSALTSSIAKITGTGNESTTLTATVTDANGNILPGVTVDWSSTTGTPSASTSDTNANGQATVTFSAVRAATTNGTATITAGTNGSTRTTPITLRAVISAGGKYFWTQYSDYAATTEATANSMCRAHGGGAAATRSNLQAFAAARADFANMSVTGEYANYWYNMAGSWGSVAGDFHSAGNPVGDTYVGAGSAYVCVK